LGRQKADRDKSLAKLLRGEILPQKLDADFTIAVTDALHHQNSGDPRTRGQQLCDTL
jgi:hypothetical protein